MESHLDLHANRPPRHQPDHPLRLPGLHVRPQGQFQRRLSAVVLQREPVLSQAHRRQLRRPQRSPRVDLREGFSRLRPERRPNSDWRGVSQMSRGMISALAAAISLVWIAGFLSLVVTNEQRSADLMAEYMYGRCLQSGSGSSNALRCLEERDAYAKTAFSRIAWPQVLPIAAVPLPVIWLGAWGV